MNYHYIFIRDDGFFDEKYQPKNSGSYVGGGQGTWKRSGNTLNLRYDDGINQQLTIKGDELIRKSSAGTVFTFKKAD